MPINADSLSGKSTAHLATRGEFAEKLHARVQEPYLALRDAARVSGFDLGTASAFRSFDRQLLIWNAKARGERPIQNELGDTLDIADLPELELLHAIMRWSALPGASRHHWGTDLDVFDAGRLEENTGPQLLKAEYEGNGPFADLNAWMEQNLAQFGFSRPYQIDRGGIAPEPWHISYQPVAQEFENQMDLACLATTLAGVELELGQTVLDHLDDIFERYIQIT